MTNEDLAVRIQAGDNTLIPQLWEQCKGFICQEAFRWSEAWKERSDFDADDLIQSGYFALRDAVSGFQADRGNFIALLSLCLKTQFSEVVKCRTVAQKNDPLNNAVSLDTLASADSDIEMTIGDTIPADDTGFEDVEEALYQQQAAVILREAVDSIPERQSEGISLYYLQGKTQRETAEQLNVSGSRAQQIIKEGLKSLRKSVYAPALTELFYIDQNFFKHTGYTYWKHSGMSAPERAVILKERIESQYSGAQWDGKVSLLVKLGYPIEKAQIIATLDSQTA